MAQIVRIRRRWLIVLLASATVFGLYLLLTRHHIDKAHFQMIKEGMTLTEVEAIFRAKPGNYDWTEPPAEHWGTLVAINAFIAADALQPADDAAMVKVLAKLPVENFDQVNSALVTHSKTWTSRHGAFEVQFDENDRVINAHHQKDVTIIQPWQRAWRWWKAK